MKNLLYLYLSDNDLMVLAPRAFEGVPELTYLHLDGNRLARFPGSGQQAFRSYLYLNLFYSCITCILLSGILFRLS